MKAIFLPSGDQSGLLPRAILLGSSPLGLLGLLQARAGAPVGGLFQQTLSRSHEVGQGKEALMNPCPLATP